MSDTAGRRYEHRKGVCRRCQSLCPWRVTATFLRGMGYQKTLGDRHGCHGRAKAWQCHLKWAWPLGKRHGTLEMHGCHGGVSEKDGRQRGRRVGGGGGREASCAAEVSRDWIGFPYGHQSAQLFTVEHLSLRESHPSKSGA